MRSWNVKLPYSNCQKTFKGNRHQESAVGPPERLPATAIPSSKKWSPADCFSEGGKSPPMKRKELPLRDTSHIKLTPYALLSFKTNVLPEFLVTLHMPSQQFGLPFTDFQLYYLDVQLIPIYHWLQTEINIACTAVEAAIMSSFESLHTYAYWWTMGNIPLLSTWLKMFFTLMHCVHGLLALCMSMGTHSLAPELAVGASRRWRSRQCWRGTPEDKDYSL